MFLWLQSEQDGDVGWRERQLVLREAGAACAAHKHTQTAKHCAAIGGRVMYTAKGGKSTSAYRSNRHTTHVFCLYFVLLRRSINMLLLLLLLCKTGSLSLQTKSTLARQIAAARARAPPPFPLASAQSCDRAHSSPHPPITRRGGAWCRRPCAPSTSPGVLPAACSRACAGTAGSRRCAAGLLPKPPRGTQRQAAQ